MMLENKTCATDSFIRTCGGKLQVTNAIKIWATWGAERTKTKNLSLHAVGPSFRQAAALTSETKPEREISMAVRQTFRLHATNHDSNKTCHGQSAEFDDGSNPKTKRTAILRRPRSSFPLSFTAVWNACFEMSGSVCRESACLKNHTSSGVMFGK